MLLNLVNTMPTVLRNKRNKVFIIWFSKVVYIKYGNLINRKIKPDKIIRFLIVNSYTSYRILYYSSILYKHFTYLKQLLIYITMKHIY